MFNNYTDLEPSQVKRIEDYFHYKWNFDKNNALQLEEVKKMMGNIPLEVNRTIVTDFLFHKFVWQFREIFRFRMWKSIHKHKFYTYEDKVFSDFILNFLKRLSPRYIQKGERMFLEQEEVDEIIFVMHGTYAIGFEINRKEKMIIRQG